MFEYFNFLDFDLCFGITHISLLLSDNYQRDKLIIPNKNALFYNESCCGIDNVKCNYYDKEENILHLQTAMLPLKNKFWDLTKIKNELEIFQNSKLNNN